MVEIKISVSDEMDDVIQEICNKLGIKKTEYVKSLVIENLMRSKNGGIFNDKK